METIRGRAFSFNSEKLNLKDQNRFTNISQPLPEIRTSRNDPNSSPLLTDYPIFPINPFQQKYSCQVFTLGSVSPPIFFSFNLAQKVCCVSVMVAVL